MRNQPHRIQRRILRPNPVPVQRLAQLHRRLPNSRAIKNHDVAPHLRRINLQPANLRNPLRQPSRILVIDVQPPRRFLQRNQPRRRDHPRLPHPASKHLPVHASLFNKRARPHNHRTHRRAQALRQAEHHRIHLARHRRHFFPQRRRRIKNPRPVQMHLQPSFVSAVANLIYLRRRIHRPAPHVDRVLQANQRRLRVVINLRPDHCLNLLPAQNPIFRSRHARHAPRNRRHRGQLIQIHMAALFANHLVAMMRPNFDRNQVPHAPGRHKQRRLFPKNLRRPRLQPVHRRVFAIDIVPDLRLRHSPPHLRRRPRNRIAAQIHRPTHWSPSIQLHHHIRLSISRHVLPLLCALCVLNELCVKSLSQSFP